MIARLAVLGIGALTLSACVGTPKSCRPFAGHFPTLVPAQATVSQLQCAADLGMQSGIVELAKRYETGTGVQADLKRAVALYTRAAAAVQPTTAIYSPPVRVGGSGQMIFLPNSHAGPGSAEAQFRLGQMLIEGRGVPRDVERGRKLIERAAAQGFSPAQRTAGEVTRN